MIRLIRRSLFWLLLLFSIWLGGLLWFSLQIPFYTATPPQADAIVVLTGGKNRLEHGLTLLAEGKSNRLFITGVHEKSTEEDLINRAPENIRRKITSMGKDSIIIGREAWNTIGNAEETLRWIRQEKINSILLVTSNYHMPRSLYEFRHLLKGVTIHPAAVPTEDYAPYSWPLSNHYRMLVLLEYHKYIGGKIRNALVRAEQSQ